MTTDQPSTLKPSVYETCDPQYLRALREAANIDLVVLARTACLSVAQVRQLESGASDSLFYSDAIKHQAYKRLLMILGAEPPSVEVPESMRDAEKVAQAHLNTLDQIVAMSSQPSMNRSVMDVLQAAFSKLAAKKQVLAAFALLVVAVTLLVLHGPQNLIASTTVVASEAAAFLPKPTVLADKPVVAVPVATVVPAPLVASAPATSTSTAHVLLPMTPTVAPTAMPAKLGVCEHSKEPLPQAVPLVATKEGRYVYLVSSANMDVCVVDGNKQATVLQLKMGESRSVYGPSPWQVSGANLDKVQIYFQGGRVGLPDASAQRISLVEVSIAR